MREGSTTRDAFFRFLQTSKKLTIDDRPNLPALRPELRFAVARVAPGKDPFKYLSSTSDDRFLSKVWRTFWFEWLATDEVLTPWTKDGSGYSVPNAFTKIERDDGTGPSQIFEGRVDGLKNLIVKDLNSGAIDEREAWDRFVAGFQVPGGRQSKQGVASRAHSYREDLDSALLQLDWIDPDGRPTDCGYRFMTLCERFGGANSAAAVEYVGATLLQTGHYGSFLHYIYRLSEQIFSADPLAFTRRSAGGTPVFNEESYWEYLSRIENELSDNLKVMRKAAQRSASRPRTTFQVELTLLRNYGFVSPSRYRLGVGIPINWVKVHEATTLEL